MHAENVEKSERIDEQFAGMCTKYDDQFAYMSAKHDDMKASHDEQFKELRGFMKQLMRRQEQREKSVSFDNLEVIKVATFKQKGANQDKLAEKLSRNSR